MESAIAVAQGDANALIDAFKGVDGGSTCFPDTGRAPSPLTLLNGAAFLGGHPNRSTRRPMGRAIGVVAIAVMVAVTLLQVVMRYVFNNALPWPDEVLWGRQAVR